MSTTIKKLVLSYGRTYKLYTIFEKKQNYEKYYLTYYYYADDILLMEFARNKRFQFHSFLQYSQSTDHEVLNF